MLIKKNEYSHLSSDEMKVQLSSAWNLLTDEEKNVYYEKSGNYSEENKEESSEENKEENSEESGERVSRNREGHDRAKSNKKKVKRTTRRKRDPCQPKRWATAWIFYMRDQRGKFRKNYPDLTMTDLTKKIAKQYNKEKRDPNIVRKYEEMEEKDRKRHDLEMMKWNNRNRSRSRSPKRSRSRSRSPKRQNPMIIKSRSRSRSPNRRKMEPKKPRNAWIFFSVERRSELMKQYPDSQHAKINKKLSKQWVAFSDEEKKVWIKKAEEDKVRYETEMTNYYIEEKVSQVY